MRALLRLLGLAALVATVGPSIAYFEGSMELPAVTRWMLVATVIWFVVQGLLVARERPRA